MKKIIVSLSFLFFFSFSLIAQQNHFIYLQTEGKQPFYVKLDKKILSSSSAGYLIIPKLTEGNYTLQLGFPKNEWAEQTLNVIVQKNDLGYLIKNFNEKGWALVDMNSYQIVYNNANQSLATKSTEKIVTPPVEVVKQTPKPVIKEEPKQIIKEEVKQIPAEQPKLIAKETSKEIVKEETVAASSITKLFSSKSTTSIESIYLVKNNGTNDTVRVFIPLVENNIQSNSTPIAPPKQEVVTTPIKTETPPVIKELEKPAEQKKPIEEVKSRPKEIAPTPAKQSHQVTCKSLANEEDYKKLRKKMAAADNDNGMLQQALSGFQKQCYTTEQIKTLSFLFLTDDGKYKFFDTAYPYVYDIDNFPKLSQLLTEEYYIKRFNAMLRN
jgi:nucleoside diphosphate kinase